MNKPLSHKLGILIDNIGKSSSNMHLFNALHRLNTQDNYANIDLFYNSMSPPFMNIPYSINHFSEVWCYNSNIVATSFSNISKLLLVPFNGKRIYYVWELEWIDTVLNYNDIESVFQNPKVKIVARSDYHKQLIQKTFNQQDVPVVDKFDIGQLLEVING